MENKIEQVIEKRIVSLTSKIVDNKEDKEVVQKVINDLLVFKQIFKVKKKVSKQEKVELNDLLKITDKIIKY